MPRYRVCRAVHPLRKEAMLKAKPSSACGRQHQIVPTILLSIRVATKRSLNVLYSS